METTRGFGVHEDGTILGRRGEPLHQRVDERGYVVVATGAGVTRVHVLVAEAFLGDSDGRDIHHIDGDRTNNSVQNLVYLSHQNHMLLHSGLDQAIVLVIRQFVNEHFAPADAFAKILGMPLSKINRIANGSAAGHIGGVTKTGLERHTDRDARFRTENAQGMTRAEIAARYSVSMRTVSRGWK